MTTLTLRDDQITHLAGLLAGVASADGDFDVLEADEIGEILTDICDGDVIPLEASRLIVSFDPETFSEPDACAALDLQSQAEKDAEADQAGAPAAAADPFAAAYSHDGPMQEEGHDATVVAKVPDALLAATARSQGGAASRDPDEEHFRQVFQDFVSTRRECGEGADALTYDKFAAKLKKNRDTIKGKHGARSVRFQVYVKAGKAALKATPVK